uniref:Uncharacterized protein n=1 Tax=Daphnia galeata TaxID=27404 RepID=A0A8J2S0Y8_9CRUS|nr:unnamed protein product [Daphnia galeata]
MRIRKTSLLFGLSCLIVFGCIVLLLGKNKNLAGEDQDLKRNYEIVQKIGKSVSDLLKESPIQNEDVLKGTNVKQDLLKSDGKSVTNDCLFVEKPPLQPDMQMLNSYSNKISHCRSLQNRYEVWTRVASKEMECWAGRLLDIWNNNDDDDHARGNEAVVGGHQLGSALLKTRSLNFAFFMFMLLICTRCFQAV